MSGTLRLKGSTSGYSELQAPAVAGDQTFILPAAGGTLLTTDSPAPTLTLESGTVTSPSLTFEGDSNTGIYSPSANELAITTGGGQRLVADSNGNIGIGEFTPVNTLQIRTPLVMSTSNGNTPGLFLNQTGGSSGNGNYGAGICFSKIDSARPGGCISSIQTSADADQMGLSFFTSPNGTPTDAVTEQFRIRHDGQLFGTDTSISSLSDQRLKENINSFSYNLDTFKLLQPKVFDWKNPVLHGDRQQQRGFVAQDIESVDSYWLDEYSVNTESADAEYLDEDRIAKTSKLGQKDAMYVSVIQQLLSKIETLETKVAALEAGS